jgi:flagellar basal-body rod modification protein FlgD
MSQINTIANSLTGKQSTGSAIKDLDVDSFLKLMIAELQNQDPLNPMENEQMLAQIGQMREIAASDKLTETLDSVLLGQNIASATNLIGAEIDAISNDNQKVTGEVKSVAIADGVPVLNLEESSGASVSDEDGELAAGEYNYKIVWEDGGNFLGIQTDKPLEVDVDGKSVLLANLPVTDSVKQVYRTKAGAKDGPFYLVGTITDGETATYLDTTNDEDLSSTVLSRTPVYVKNAHRKFEVNLNNVGAVRPPATTTTTTTTQNSNNTNSNSSSTNTSSNTGNSET